MDHKMEIGYYPGCTLKTKAQNFETSALPLLQKFDVQANELSNWYCCGACYSMTDDNLMYQLAPVRTLLRAKESGHRRLLVLCSMCYNTLQRTRLLVKNSPEKAEKIKHFMYREETQLGGDDVEVVHLLTLLKEIGAEAIAQMAGDKNGIKAAAYYGCLLLRPQEVALDSPENPTIMENLLEAAGCETVPFPFRTECCASYQVVNEPAIVLDRTKKIVRSAAHNGAHVIVTSCPLCHYNLDAMQAEILKTDKDFKSLPVLYISQLLAPLLGLKAEPEDFSQHKIAPGPVLESWGLI